ncbi:hypothetical protein GCM10027160_33890 [Streptomyces calidiresistens]
MVRYVGFLREPPHGDPDAESLLDAVGRGDDTVRSPPADYLDTGYVLATTGQRTKDILDDRRPDSGPLDVRTDGEWVWPGDLSHRVRRYNVAPPAALIDAARSRARPAPAPSPEEPAAVRDDMLPPP